MVELKPKCRWADVDQVWLTNLTTGKSELAFYTPLKASVGDEIAFLIVAWNMGDAGGDCFVKLINSDTGAVIGRWDGYLDVGATFHVRLDIGAMPNIPIWRLRVDCGHIESSSAEVVDHTRGTLGVTEGAFLPPIEVDLPMIGGIALAVVDAALIGYYAVTQLPKL